MSSQDPDAAQVVLYNGACPICRFEVDHHRSRAQAQGLDVSFQDFNGTDLSDWGVDADSAARRLHARTGRGMVTGWDANLAMWRAMPRWRWAARLGGAPGLRPIGAFVYERVFAPLIYKLHLRREGR